jgi:hypothetical protein
VLELLVSRYLEFRADSFAIEEGLSRQLGSALLKLSFADALTVSPDPFYSTFRHSYPCIHERLQQIRNFGVDLTNAMPACSSDSEYRDSISWNSIPRQTRTDHVPRRVINDLDYSVPVRLHHSKIKRI